MDIEEKRYFAKAFYVFQTNRNRQEAVTGRDSSWSEAFMRAMIHFEYMLFTVTW